MKKDVPTKILDLGVTDFRSFLHLQLVLFECRRKTDGFPNLIIFSEHPPCYSLKTYEYQQAERHFRAPIEKHPHLTPFISLGNGGLVPIIVLPPKLKPGRPTFHGRGVLGIYIIGAINHSPHDILLNLSLAIEKTLQEWGATPKRATNPYDLWIEQRKVAAAAIGYGFAENGILIARGGISVNYDCEQEFLDAVWPCGERAGLGAGSLKNFPKFSTLTRELLIERTTAHLTNFF